MADRTLTINHADGGSETYTLKTEDVLGVRNMSVDGETVTIDRTAPDLVRTIIADGQTITIDTTREGVRTLTVDGTEITIDRSEEANLESFLQEFTGASAAYHYGFLVRTETPVDFNDGYARFVHCDYNVARIESMSHDVLRDNGVEPKKGELYAWFNTLQPFDNPAINNPLAFIDAGSLPREDVIDYYYTGRNRDSLVAAPVYNPNNRWCYFPEMTTDEVIILKQMDQRPDRVLYCPHTSFDNPTAEAEAPPRRSIETRVLAVFK